MDGGEHVQFSVQVNVCTMIVEDHVFNRREKNIHSILKRLMFGQGLLKTMSSIDLRTQYSEKVNMFTGNFGDNTLSGWGNC